MFNKTLSVEQLNGYIHSIFEAEEMLQGVSVFGEVSGFKISGAHAYFTIKGRDAAIPCTLFNYRRTYTPKDGESVILKGSPDFYVKGGKLSFNVVSVQPVGIGDLHAQYERLKAQLTEEGIFAPEHKIPIPEFCKDVCVITSKTGAVIRDIYRTTRNVNKSINLHVYNVRVQGDGAENEIVDALKKVDGKFDAIIIARGGGSLEDLAPFNTECLARAIYDAVTPVISAVGHETDFTICDFAADARAATPTAAAHMIAFDETQIIGEIFELLTKMGMTLQDAAAEGQKELSVLVKSLTQSATLITEKSTNRYNMAASAVINAAKSFLSRKENTLDKTLLSYNALNPLKILEKGYFGATKGDKRVTSTADVAVGDEVTLIAKDGKIHTKVKEITK